MNAGRAFLAGVVGAVVMSIVMALARGLGMEVHLELMLGTLVRMAPGGGAWFIGFVVHLVIGGMFGMLYVAIMEKWVHRCGPTTGSVIGLAHAAIVGLLFAAIPAMHPLMPMQMPAPGIYMSGAGVMGVIAFFLLHVVYGAIAGWIYKPVIETAGRTARAGHPAGA